MKNLQAFRQQGVCMFFSFFIPSSFSPFRFFSLHSTRWDSVRFSYCCCTSPSYWFFFVLYKTIAFVVGCVCIFVFSSTTVTSNIMIAYRSFVVIYSISADWVYVCAWASEWVSQYVLCVHKLCENEIQDETKQRD